LLSRESPPPLHRPTLFCTRSAGSVNRYSLPWAYKSACGSVLLDIIRNASRPDFPKNTHPGSGKYADSVRMSATERSGICVNSGGPRRAAAGVVRQERDGNAQSVIASPAKGHAARFAALLSCWGNACFGGKLLSICQPLTDIPYSASTSSPLACSSSLPMLLAGAARRRVRSSAAE
jgi:hypothetical protein